MERKALLPPEGSRTAKNGALRRPVAGVRRAASDSRAFLSVLGVSYDVAQHNCREAHNQLFETSNLLLAVFQLVLFVRHHRYFMAISRCRHDLYRTSSDQVSASD